MKIGTLIKIKGQDTPAIGVVVGIIEEEHLDVRGLNGLFLDKRWIIRKSNKYVEVLCK